MNVKDGLSYHNPPPCPTKKKNSPLSFHKFMCRILEENISDNPLDPVKRKLPDLPDIKGHW